MYRNQIRHFIQFGLPGPLAATWQIAGNDLHERAAPFRRYIPMDEKDATINQMVEDEPMNQRMIYAKAKTLYANISTRDVKAAFSRNVDYQQARPKKARDSTIEIRADYPLHWVQIDLVGVDGYPRPFARNRAVYVLTAIDVFSRHAWAKCITDKRADTVHDALVDIINEMPRKPNVIQSDRGSEFKGAVANVLEQNDIKQVMSAAYSPTTQAYIERFHRTFRRSIELYFASDQTGQAVFNQQLVDMFLLRYNDTVHSGTKQKPNVMLRQQGARRPRPVPVQPPAYAVGSRVRVALTRINKADRKLANAGLTRRIKNWSAEVYVVTSVDTVKASKPIYKIKLAQPQARQLPGWVHEYQLIEATD